MQILDVVCAYKVFLGKKAEWHGRYHSHGPNNFEIHYFIEGDGSFLANTKRISIKSNTIFISAPGEFHSLSPDKIVKPLTYYAVLFYLDKEKDKMLYERLCDISENSHKYITIEGNNLQFIFEEILHSFNAEDEVVKKAADFLFEGLVYKLFMKHPDVPVESFSPRSETHKKYVEKAISIMERRVNENVQVEEFADVLGISVEHFIRVFREATNITPLQYFNQLKIKAASVMICNTNLPIGDISQKMAFENQFHFARVFKKHTGHSPTEYRLLYSQKSRE